MRDWERSIAAPVSDFSSLARANATDKIIRCRVRHAGREDEDMLPYDRRLGEADDCHDQLTTTDRPMIVSPRRRTRGVGRGRSPPMAASHARVPELGAPRAGGKHPVVYARDVDSEGNV
jgi:hypothetical protein